MGKQPMRRIFADSAGVWAASAAADPEAWRSSALADGTRTSLKEENKDEKKRQDEEKIVLPFCVMKIFAVRK